MFEQKHGKDPTAMRVEFVIVESEERRYQGMLVLRAKESTDEFSRQDGAGTITCSHQFKMPAASLFLRFDEPANDRPDRVIDTAFAMGVHQSVEWESLMLGNQYVFWFRCTPLFWPAGA